MQQNSSNASGIYRRDLPGLRHSLSTFSHLLAWTKKQKMSGWPGHTRPQGICFLKKEGGGG